MTSSARVVYAGTPDFAVPALRALVDAGHDVVAVYTQPDRPSGRGRRPRPGPVKQAAESAGIPVHQPETLRTDEARRTLAALKADVMVVAAYGLILPAAILATPACGCLNIHASLLPRWRGAAPIQRALLAGDAVTGVCLMRMEAGLDTGPVVACREYPVAAGDTGGRVHDRLADLGAALLVETLPGYLAGERVPVPQPHEGVTYARKLDKAEARVDWSRPAVDIERLIRAFDPWPVAFTRCGDANVRLWRAGVLDAVAAGEPGEVVAAGPEGVDVATGDGTLRLLELQAPGRRRQPVRDFLNGFPLRAGVRLGDG